MRHIVYVNYLLRLYEVISCYDSVRFDTAYRLLLTASRQLHIHHPIQFADGVFAKAIIFVGGPGDAAAANIKHVAMIRAVNAPFAGDGAAGHVARGVGAFAAEGVNLPLEPGEDNTPLPDVKEGHLMGGDGCGREGRLESVS